MIFFKTDIIHAQDSVKLASSGPPDGTGEWQLIWQDEFNGTSIDTSKWNIEGNWDLNPNDQLDYWVNTANTSVADGNLILKVDYDSVNKRYNGAGIHSNNKYEHLYGYYEARILFPTQQGQNPAFWMHSWNMPHIDSSGVDGSEIDIIEKPQDPQSNLVSSGAWLLDTDIFKYPPEIHKNGEYYIPDAVRRMLDTHPMYVVQSSFWMPVTCPQDLEKANRFLLSEEAERRMA